MAAASVLRKIIVIIHISQLYEIGAVKYPRTMLKITSFYFSVRMLCSPKGSGFKSILLMNLHQREVSS